MNKYNCLDLLWYTCRRIRQFEHWRAFCGLLCHTRFQYNDLHDFLYFDDDNPNPQLALTYFSTEFAVSRHARRSSRRRAIPCDDAPRPYRAWHDSGCRPCRQSAGIPLRWMAPSTDRCRRPRNQKIYTLFPWMLSLYCFHISICREKSIHFTN